MNRLLLAAQLTERGGLRYTPAGVPALDVQLQHQGDVTEDGQPRTVRLSLKAVALGAMAGKLDGLALGSQGVFAGFLAAGRNGRGWIFHITSFEAEAAPQVHAAAPS